MAVAIPFILAAMSAASAIQQGKIASANAKSQANIEDYNAKVAENNAITARQEAAANQEAQRRQSSFQLGTMRAGMAESGAGLDSSNIYSQSAATADLDARNISYSGEVKAAGLDSSAGFARENAATSRSNASAITAASYVSAGAAALSSYGSYMTSSAKLRGTV